MSREVVAELRARLWLARANFWVAAGAEYSAAWRDRFHESEQLAESYIETLARMQEPSSICMADDAERARELDDLAAIEARASPR